MDGAAARATTAGFAAAQVVVEGDVEEVAERPPVVVAEGQAALVFAGGFCAAVVGGEGQAKRHVLLVLDHQVAAAGRALHGLDPDLGPIFNERVADWERHFVQLGAFWSSVTIGTGAYAGSPMQKHLKLPVDSRHFDQWLRLFGATVMELCPPVAARVFLERAMRIAESLELAIAGDLGLILAKDERLVRPELQTTLPAS